MRRFQWDVPSEFGGLGGDSVQGTFLADLESFSGGRLLRFGAVVVVVSPSEFCLDISNTSTDFEEIFSENGRCSGSTTERFKPVVSRNGLSASVMLPSSKYALSVNVCKDQGDRRRKHTRHNCGNHSW